MKPVTLNRRRLLQATGLGAASLFLPSLLSTKARAALSLPTPPKRLVIFWTQHGTVYDNWHMRPAALASSTTPTSDFNLDLTTMAESDFSQVLQPLWAMRNKVTVVDGVAMVSAEADVIGNNHDIGTRHSLTGALLQSGSAGGPSIDQIVSNQIKVAGRIDSLELAVVATANGGAIYRGPGQAVPADASPTSVWGRVFPSGTAPTNTPTDAVRVQNAQSSVLDLVRNEYDILAPKLSSNDMQKLQLHRDLVRDMESRLQQWATVQCAAPASPSTSGAYGTAPYYDSNCDAMFSMTAAALACDLTRVVSIQMGQLSTDEIGAPPGDVHADYAHHETDNATAKQFMTTYSRVHATQFAQLLAMLDAIPEGNGTLLDNCCVVWCGELASGVHDLRPWPIVIGGGAIQGGRYLYTAPNTPNPSTGTTFPNYTPVIGPPHNKLWVRVAQSLGANVTSVGATQLHTPDGQLIDCTGPLPGL